jgi:hypothetical protein
MGMRTDYSGEPGGRQDGAAGAPGPRGPRARFVSGPLRDRAPLARLPFLAAGLLAAAALLLGACGGEEPSPGALDDAFLSAHPSVTRPEALATVPASLEGLRQDLDARLQSEAPVVLPGAMPSGWGLAAPYIAVGNGSALPNPESWPGGYRVTFTDGAALFIVAVGLDHVPGAGAWEPAGLRAGGRPLFRRADGRSTVLATRPATDWRLTLIGAGITSAETEALARSLVFAPAAP